jgi:hypothetical protein
MGPEPWSQATQATSQAHVQHDRISADIPINLAAAGVHREDIGTEPSHVGESTTFPSASSVQRTCRSVAVSAVTFGVGAEEHGVGVGAEEHGGVTKDRSALDGAVCGARWITSHHRQRPVGGQARSGLTSEQSIEERTGQSKWPKNWARPAANTVAPRATSLAS